jgi:endonuclease VIII
VPPGADRQAVPEAESRRVYKRSHCEDCGTPVITAQVNGRTAYSCPRCQPR